MPQFVKVDMVGAVAVLTLCDPHRRNILTTSMVQAIAEAMDQLESHADVRAVVLTGAGPAFCAGAELATLEHASAGDFELIRAVYNGFLRVVRSPLMTVAAVNGPAVGAGFNLALACDLRLASESARFISRFSELRILPGGGHVWLLSRLVGQQRATASVLLQESWDASQALADGLVLDVFPDHELVDRTIERLAPLADLEPEFVRRLVELTRVEPTLARHEVALEIEADQQQWSIGQPGFVQGLARLRAGQRA